MTRLSHVSVRCSTMELASGQRPAPRALCNEHVWPGSNIRLAARVSGNNRRLLLREFEPLARSRWDRSWSDRGYGPAAVSPPMVDARQGGVSSLVFRGRKASNWVSQGGFQFLPGAVGEWA